MPGLPDGGLVNDDVLMTTRRTAEVFTENRNEVWQFRPGITTWMDYRSPYQCVASAGYRVGYDDASQFSREYKRMFGQPPVRDVERLREAAGR